jgi:hypothetical protein
LMIVLHITDRDICLDRCLRLAHLARQKPAFRHRSEPDPVHAPNIRPCGEIFEPLRNKLQQDSYEDSWRFLKRGEN